MKQLPERSAGPARRLEDALSWLFFAIVGGAAAGVLYLVITSMTF